jgi:hypothetical protein
MVPVFHGGRLLSGENPPRRLRPVQWYLKALLIIAALYVGYRVTLEVMHSWSALSQLWDEVKPKWDVCGEHYAKYRKGNPCPDCLMDEYADREENTESKPVD